MVELADLSQIEVLRESDVAVARERMRRRRVWALMGFVAVLETAVIAGLLVKGTAAFRIPGIHLSPTEANALPACGLILVLVLVMAVPLLGAGRSPHTMYQPGDIKTGLADVVGCPVVVDEVVRTLNLFLANKTFKDKMGGTPRRAILFEGPPGTGKTYIAKAMAHEAGVPFLFVASSAFQSMYYGQTNRKIRSYFKSLRKVARQYGGAIGFIEEIDAIGASRSGMGGHGREGVSGGVNELLIQLQSFDEPTRGVKIASRYVDLLNGLLPAKRRIRRPTCPPANFLVVGATNRKDDLDPALLRPGRFDRSLMIDIPNRSGRREIIDYYLAKKAHAPALDDDDRRDTLAAMTMGYSPVMIEHLFDEALVWALRRGAESLTWDDLHQAKMTEEIGLAQPASYTETERRVIATHEAGHATIAHLVAQNRTLEVLSIIKHGHALGLLSHADSEERFTRSQPEIEALIKVAMGGMAAELVFFGEISTGPAGDLQAATLAGLK